MLAEMERLRNRISKWFQTIFLFCRSLMTTVPNGADN